MPVLEEFLNNQGYPQPHQPVMDIAAAGQAASALARGAAGVSEQFADFANQYAEQKRAITASDAMVGLDNQLGDAAIRWSRTADMAQARQGFNDEADALRAQAMKQYAGDPFLQQMIVDRFNQAQIARSWDVTNTSFGLEASAARGNLDTQLAGLRLQAATAPTPEARALAMDDADRAIASRSPLYLPPEQAAQKKIQFRSDVSKVQAEQFINRAMQDPSLSRLSPFSVSSYIDDPKNFPLLTPQDRETLSIQATRDVRTAAALRAADQAHSDAAAERNLRAAQAGNAATIADQVKQMTPADAAAFIASGKASALVRTQQLSESGYSMIESAARGAGAGRDDPQTVVDLYRDFGAGQNVVDRAFNAYAAGNARLETALNLQKATAERARQGESAVDAGNFNSLKTALSGAAIDSGSFFGAKEDKEKATQLWGQAQAEWTQRVRLGREDSGAVLNDMLARYAKPITDPGALPQPRLGAAGNLDQVKATWAATKAAHAAHQMSDADYEREAQLLNRYAAIFDQQQRAAAAAKGAGAAPAAKAARPESAPSIDMNP